MAASEDLVLQQAPSPVVGLDGGGLVGRAEARAALDDAVAAAAEGAGRVVVLTGAAGAGKTVLARRAAARAADRGLSVAWGQGWAGGAGPALAPWAEVGVAVGRPDLVGDEVRALDGGDEGGLDRPRRFAALADAVLEALGAAGGLLVLDDLHWVDPASMEVLRHLLRRVDGRGVAVVLAVRQHELHASPVGALLVGEARQARWCELGPLDVADVDALLADRLGRRLPTAWVEAVHRRSGGNPLFVVELARSLAPVVDRGPLPATPPEDLPVSVVEVVAAELARLDPDDRRVVEAAAVVGEVIDVPVVAHVVGRPPAAVLDSLELAGRRGLVRAAAPRPAFEHALVRDAVLDGVSAGRRAELHRGAAEALAAHHGPDARPAERAAHLLAALPLVDPGEVVAAHRAAAAEAGAALAWEDEARLARQALDVDAAAGVLAVTERIDLALTAGRAADRAGDRPVATAALLAAADLARSVGDDERLAAVALALPPHIEVVDNAPLGSATQVALLGEALERLGADGDPRLRSRLAAKAAVALYWHGPTGDRARDVRVTAPRRAELGGLARTTAAAFGDPDLVVAATLAEQLATWGPHTVVARRRTIAELAGSLDGADEAGVLAVGRWQVLALLEDGAVDRAALLVEDLGARAARARRGVDAWQVAKWRATLALARGRLDEAEALARVAADVGEQVIDRGTALDSASVLVGLVRHLQGRGAETAESATALTGDLPEVPAWRIGVLTAHLAAGRVEAASAEWSALAADGFAGIPEDLNWVHSVHLLSALAPFLGDEDERARLHELLAPHAERFAVQAFGNAVYGHNAHALAGLERSLGDLGAAEAHLRAALTACAEVEVLQPAIATDLAAVLRLGGRPGDRGEAERLAGAAAAGAAAMGLVHEQARAAAELAKLAEAGRPAADRPAAEGAVADGAAADRRVADGTVADGAVADRPVADGAVADGGRPAGEDGGPAPAPGREGAARRSPGLDAHRRGWCRRQGETWSIGLDGHEGTTVRDGKGIRVLAALLASPGRELPVVELDVVADGDAPDRRPAPDADLHEPGHAGDALDAEARAAYRDRIVELQAELDEAAGWDDQERLARRRAELDLLVDELAANTGLSGRPRRAGSRPERSRVRITKLVRRTIDRLERQDPVLGAHLAGAVRTGTLCAYEPDPSAPVDWSVER